MFSVKLINTLRFGALFGSLAVSSIALAELPATGTLMNAVETEYGSPNDKTLPIGQPPITRWIYDNFSVVFENDHVIHAFPRIATVEERPIEAIPDRPDFVSLIDQSRNKPDSSVPAVTNLIDRSSPAQQEAEIQRADEAAATVQ